MKEKEENKMLKVIRELKLPKRRKRVKMWAKALTKQNKDCLIGVVGDCGCAPCMKYCSEEDYLPLKEFLEEYETCLEEYPVSIKITQPNLMYIPDKEERKRLRKMHILIDIG